MLYYPDGKYREQRSVGSSDAPPPKYRKEIRALNMIYEEKTPKWHVAALFLVTAMLLCYPLWQLGDRELYWSESSYAAMAMETDYLAPSGQAHGEIIPLAFPLLPVVAAVLHNELGVPMELALRIPSVVALFLLALLVWMSARHAAGTGTAAIAVAILVSSNIVLEKAVDGYPDMLGVLFLFAGWMFWFRIGAVRGDWDLAWVVSLGCCGLAFYTIGWAGLFFFFVPLIFMRRPLTLWQKLWRPGFYIGLGLVLLFICWWALPRITAGHMPFRSFPLRTNHVGSYLEHLFYFPFDVMVRFLPWTVFMWAPFCVALQPLDKNPIFARFLRTIAISLFVLIWFSPFTEPRDIVLLGPPLAILTGSYYPIVVRRYGYNLSKVLRYFIYVTIPGGLFLVVFYLAPTSWWEPLVDLGRSSSFHDNPKYIILGLVYGIIMIATGIILMFAPKRALPIWIVITMLIGVCVLFFWAIPHPYKAQENQKREMAEEMYKAITRYGSMPACIYKGPQDLGLYGECYYLGGKFRRISALSELPKDDDVVFLLSSEPPLDPSRSRTWTNIVDDSRRFRNEKLYLWRGVKSNLKTGVGDGGKH